MHATDIVAYTFNADEYDPDCIVEVVISHLRSVTGALGVLAFPVLDGGDIETQLDAIAAWLGIDRQDERSFDSGDFPKVIFGSDELYEEPGEDDGRDPDGEATPRPRRCGRCHRALDPGYEEPSSGWQVTIVVDVDAETATNPREAALAAWDSISHDGPPVVTVQPATDDPADGAMNAVTIDLSDATA